MNTFWGSRTLFCIPHMSLTSSFLSSRFKPRVTVFVIVSIAFLIIKLSVSQNFKYFISQDGFSCRKQKSQLKLKGIYWLTKLTCQRGSRAPRQGLMQYRSVTALTGLGQLDLSLELGNGTNQSTHPFQASWCNTIESSDWKGCWFKYRGIIRGLLFILVSLLIQ